MADFKEALNANDLIDIMRGFDKAIEDQGRIEQMMIDLRYKEVLPAIKEAEETVKKVDNLVKESKVNKQSISNIQSAIEQAKIGANTAMARAQELLKDINHINDKWADSDRTINEQRQKLEQWGTELTNAKANLQSLHDNLNDTAKELSSLTDQAKKQGDTLILVQQNMDGLKQSVADVKGNVTSLSQQAELLQATVTDQSKSISQLTIKADGLSSQVSTLNDKANQQAQSISQFNQTATSLQGQVASLTDASGKQAKQISEMKLDNEGWHTAVSELSETSAVNLLSNSVPDWVTQAGDGYATKTLPAFEVKPGEQYTVTVEYRNYNRGQNNSLWWVELWPWVDGKGRQSPTIGNIQVADRAGTAKETFTIPQGVTKMTVNFAFHTGDQKGSSIEYRHVMVNKGTVAQPYTDNHYSFKDVATIDQTAKSLTATVANNSGDLATLKQTANELRSDITNANGDINSLRITAQGLTNQVGTMVSKADLTDTTKKITDLSTLVSQNKSAIQLKANQTDVDRVKQQVSDATAQLSVQANEIAQRVTKSDVTNSLKGYATEDYVAGQIKTSADNINLNVTNLETRTKESLMGAGINIIPNTSDQWQQITEGGYGIKYFSPFPVNAGETYTFSVEYRNFNRGNGTLWGMQVWPATATSRKSPIIVSKYNDGQSASGKLSVTVTVPSGESYLAPNFNFSNGNQTGASVEWRRFKVERGSIATPWTPAPSDLATVKSVTDLTVGLDGIKQTVQSKADKSEITTLSNAIQQKVSSNQFESRISQLDNDWNVRITDKTSGENLMNEINVSAGRTLFNGGKVVINGDTIISGGTAWIDSAMIASLAADKIYFPNPNVNGKPAYMSAQVGALDPNAPAGTLSTRYTTGYEVTSNDRASFLMLNQDELRLAHRADSSVSDNFYGVAADKTQAWLIAEGGGFFAKGVGKNKSKVIMSMTDGAGIMIGDDYYYDTTENGKSYHQPVLEVGKISKLWSDPYMEHGWANMRMNVYGWLHVDGYVDAMGLNQTSTLSSKTNVIPMDTKEAYNMVNGTDLTWFNFKSELKDGVVKRHAGPIIDDVNKVSHYSTPKDFISVMGTSRDDNNMIGVLMGAVQYLSKKVEKLENNG